jgi:hypothetical protein
VPEQSTAIATLAGFGKTYAVHNALSDNVYLLRNTITTADIAKSEYVDDIVIRD